MHDFLLGKEIIEELLKISKEKNLSAVKNVELEIGEISHSHDGYPEHAEEIEAENLSFNLKLLAKGTPFEKTEFEIKKVSGKNWKINNLET